MYIGVVLDKT